MSVSVKSLERVLYCHEDSEIVDQFRNRYQSSLDEFLGYMSDAFEGHELLDETLSSKDDKQGAIVSALVYATFNAHVIGMKLLVSGLLMPAGNTQRYALECIALALLCSKPDLGFLDRYMNNEYSSSKAPRDVLRYADQLSLEKKSLNQLDAQVKHYGKFSHPSQFSLSSLMIFGQPGDSIALGGSFDSGKDFAYEKEITSRVSLASIFPNIIFGVARNWHEIA